MARNVEIRARVAQGLAALAALEARVAPLADRGPELLLQDDTFFHCANGRLKLREFADGSAELIAYERASASGPRLSDYLRVPVADAAGLRDALARSNGLRGRVLKRRTLYRVDRTRVHLDAVDGLGESVELEVMLREGEGSAAGERVAHDLMQPLGIPASALIAEAYIDLLKRDLQGHSP